MSRLTARASWGGGGDSVTSVCAGGSEAEKEDPISTDFVLFFS